MCNSARRPSQARLSALTHALSRHRLDPTLLDFNLNRNGRRTQSGVPICISRPEIWPVEAENEVDPGQGTEKMRERRGEKEERRKRRREREKVKGRRTENERDR